jgi:hypothetical protein
MSLLVALAVGVAVGAALETAVMVRLAGWLDPPVDPRVAGPIEERTRGGEIWKLHE